MTEKTLFGKNEEQLIIIIEEATGCPPMTEEEYEKWKKELNEEW